MSEKNKDAKNRDANSNANPAVTDAPQHEEHLHMALLGESASLREVYLKVSDDTGQFFGDMDMEAKMIDFLAQSKTLAKKGSIEEIKRIMPELIEISVSYQRQINFATNVSNGILVKHQIRLGHIFLQQKRLLKKIEPGMNWLDWFKKTYGSRNLRSAQDYMRLAKTPNIIRYAVFGKERLIEILRAITSYGSVEDPIGTFLAKYGFIYNPDAEDFMEDWRSSIDAAIAMEKIGQVEKDQDLKLELSFEQVKALIDNNVPVESGVINDMVIVKESGGSVVDYIETSVLGKGSKHINIERAEKQESVQRISKKLREIVEFYSKQTDAISEINVAAIDDLRQSIEALTALLNR
jgi:hypothetical protein